MGRFEGYYKEPELTASMIDKDGWFHSGDLASMSADGYLSYEGRLKDALKVGGENVSPMEVEDFIRAHPAVSIVSVVGAPDPRYREVVTAFIELNPGAQTSQEEIVEFCLDRIATFKVPRYVRFVSEWPMSGTKIAKRGLRDQIADELRQAGITQGSRRSVAAPREFDSREQTTNGDNACRDRPRTTPRGRRRTRRVDGAVFPEHRFTYRELLDEANRASRLLVGLGLAPAIAWA